MSSLTGFSKKKHTVNLITAATVNLIRKKETCSAFLTPSDELPEG
jgi:hypothetical protein